MNHCPTGNAAGATLRCGESDGGGRGNGPPLWGTAPLCAMGHSSVLWGTVPTVCYGALCPLCAMGHSSVLWGTALCYGALCPLCAMGHSSVLWGTALCHGAPPHFVLWGTVPTLCYGAQLCATGHCAHFVLWGTAQCYGALCPLCAMGHSSVLWGTALFCGAQWGCPIASLPHIDAAFRTDGGGPTGPHPLSLHCRWGVWGSAVGL